MRSFMCLSYGNSPNQTKRCYKCLKWEVVLGVPERVNIPCLVHNTRPYHKDDMLAYAYKISSIFLDNNITIFCMLSNSTISLTTITHTFHYYLFIICSTNYEYYYPSNILPFTLLYIILSTTNTKHSFPTPINPQRQVFF